MEQNRKIAKSREEEPKGAAHAKNKDGVSKKPPPYSIYNPNNKKENGIAPYSPYKSYIAKKEQNDGLFTSTINSNYLDMKTPRNEREEKEKQMRYEMTQGFNNATNTHYAELDKTNDLIGADGVANQYRATMNPTGNQIASGKTPYDDSADRNQAVMASAAVYGGDSLIYSPTEWETSDLLDGKINEKHNIPTGFKFQLFEREELNENNKKEKRYMLAFAGTEDIIDWNANIKEMTGQSKQHEDAASLARVVANLVGGADKVIFTGHSLGGGLASVAAYATGSNSITFNAAAVSDFTKEKMKEKYNDIDIEGRESNINSYVNAGEIIDLLNRVRQLKAAGNFKYVHKKNDPILGKYVAKHGIENFFEIFNMDVEHPEDFINNLNKDKLEDLIKQYENSPEKDFPQISDYSGGLGPKH